MCTSASVIPPHLQHVDVAGEMKSPSPSSALSQPYEILVQALRCLHGHGRDKDPEEAVRLFRLSAVTGYISAVYHL